MEKNKTTSPLFTRRLSLIVGMLLIASVIALIVWISLPTRHTVVFYQNDGADPPEHISVSIIEGESVDLPPELRRTGHVFLGWTLDFAGEQPFDLELPITKDLFLYAQWHVEFPVLFYVNDKSGTAPAWIRVLYGESVPEPEMPSRYGYRFLYWTRDPGGEQYFSFASPVTERIRLYAQWHKEFTLTFHPEGGSGEPEALIVLEGEEVPEPDAPSRYGYRFIRWTQDLVGEHPFDFTTPIMEDKDLFAQWRVFPPPTDTLDELLARHNNLSVYFKNLDTGFTYLHNADRIFMGASVPKAPFSLYIYQKAEEDGVELDERQLRLLRTNLSISDNEATLALARIHGTAGYRQFVAELGGNPDFVISSVMGSRLTASEAGLFALAIYNYIESESRYSEEMKTHLLDNYFPFIVSDYPVASKSGWTPSVLHDMAIVYAPSPYILVILSQRAGSRTFEEISMAFQAFNDTWFVD